MPEWAPELFKYFCCKKEIGDSGTPHLQCYGECINPHTLKTLQNALSKKSRIPSRWAAFVAKGTGRQNLDYVSKTGPPDYEHGVLKTQGQRSDLEEVAELINQGKKVREVSMLKPCQYIRYASGIERLIFQRQTVRSWITIGYWLSGETGAGKSRWANINFPDAYYKDPETDWWDGYQQQETVIVDDYRPSKSLSFAKILRIVDRYPLTVQVKCGTAQFASKRIVFTSPQPLRATFSACEWLHEEDLAQLERRFPHQLEFGKTTMTHHLSRNVMTGHTYLEIENSTI